MSSCRIPSREKVTEEGTDVAEELLTLDERRKYRKRVRPRYLQADRAWRGALLTEREAVAGV
jgi:hypothetical protein